MMADADVPDVGLTASIVDPTLNDNSGQITIVECTPEDAGLLSVTGGEEPAPKRIKLDDESLLRTSDSVSIKQILFNINQAICLRLDAIENKLESVSNTTKMLEDKLEQLCSGDSHNLNESPNTSVSNATLQNTPSKEISMATSPASSSKKTGGGAVVVGMPQTVKKPGSSLSGNEDDSTEERYVVNLAGSNLNNSDQNVQSLGPNVTLITLNSEEDFPHGTWLGDENNPEMRVRVPISPSDLLHIHSNCRTAEKMALTLLDYLFDRETQAYSNLSGMGKHGKKQLDPLMIYGVRCHLIHHFNVSEQDWHRIKQNINSKCRTAFRRKVRGLPLTVKAFRGKAPPTYIHIPHAGLPGHHRISDLGDASDDSLQHDDELQIQTEVDVSQPGLISGSTAEIIQSTGGQIQVLHATPEQVAQLQQTHQIQILQGDQLMQFQAGDSHESIHVAVPMPPADADGIHVVNTENGEAMSLPPGTISQDVTQEMVQRIPKVEDDTDHP